MMQNKKATTQKIYYQTVSFFGFNFLFIFLNIKFDFIAGWFVLFITGTLCAFYYWLSLDHRDALHLDRRDNHLELEYTKSVKNIVIFLLIILILSINWAYQVEKNQTVQKQEAVNEIVKISGSGWCANFKDYDTYVPGLDDPFEGQGIDGWPCIYVSKIYDVDFSKAKDDMNLCFSYSLKRSEGLPSESRYFEDFELKKLCLSDNSWESLGGGWSEQSLKMKIYKNLESDLDELETTMCKLYSSRLSEEELNVYC